MPFRFPTTIELGGKTATGFRVPAEVVGALGRGKRPPVRVTIAGHSYRSTVAVYGGEYFLPLAAEHRERAGVAAGQTVEVEVELDTAPREVELPPELAAALAEEPALVAAFGSRSFTARRELAESVRSAKGAETRQRRLERVLDELRGQSRSRSGETRNGRRSPRA